MFRLLIIVLKVLNGLLKNPLPFVSHMNYLKIKLFVKVIPIKVGVLKDSILMVYIQLQVATAQSLLTCPFIHQKNQKLLFWGTLCCQQTIIKPISGIMKMG